MTPITRRLASLVVAALAVASLTSCGDDGNSPDTGGPGTPSFAELVGTWTGTARSETAGIADMTWTLRADSTMTAESNSPSYPTIQGRWKIEGDQFIGIATVNTITVTQTARAGRRSMSGTWNSTNGAAGTFSVAKQ